MPIFDDTGQSPSITEGPRALRLFTDRHHLIRTFTRALHEEDALGKILFFQGGGGNGKSLLIWFLREYACKRYHYWEEISQLQDATFIERLQRERSFAPLPVASLDFHAPPREFEQPMVDYDALLMLRRQLGEFQAEGFSRLHFPLYDFAAVWYLHRTGRLSEARLSSLFPSEESSFVLALADAISKDVPGAGLAQAVLGLANKHLREWWTLYQARRGVDPTLLKDIQVMDPERDLIPELPRLFALDLNAALGVDNAPPRIVLLFDGHDAFAAASSAPAPESERDRWLRYLLGSVDLSAGVVPVVTSRRELRWEERPRYTIPTEYVEPLTIGHFSDVDAHDYLKKAGVNDLDLRARLCDYARVAPYEVHPLYAGLGADVVLQASHQGRHLTVEDFPKEPDVEKKPRVLVERLLSEASAEVEYAVRSLAAARAFDRNLFEKLSSWGRSRYSATDAAFETLTQFSFVWKAETRGEGWYSIHALLRRILRERGDKRLREADEALSAIYFERFQRGDELALAESIYHAYQQSAEIGLDELLAVFELAIDRRRYDLCEAMRTILAEFRQPEDTWWRARVAKQEGFYFSVRFRYPEADEALQESAAAYEEALNDTSEPSDVYNEIGEVLAARARLKTYLSQYPEAEVILRASLAASEEAIGLAPDSWEAYDSKGTALAELGKVLAELSRHDEADRAHGEAIAAHDEALQRAPETPAINNNKGNTLVTRGDLLSHLSRYDEAERSYAQADAAFKEALRHAPHLWQTLLNKAGTLVSRARLLVRLTRYAEAEKIVRASIAALNEVSSRAPDDTFAPFQKANALSIRADLRVHLSQYAEAKTAYDEAIAAYDEALRRAPDHTLALNNKGDTLLRYAGLLAKLFRHEEAERTYAEAVVTLDETLSRAPDSWQTHINKGDALSSRGDSLAHLSRYTEAEESLKASIAAYGETLSRVPDLWQAYFKKGNALWSRGDVLVALSRPEEVEKTYTGAVVAFDEALNRLPQGSLEVADIQVKKGITLRLLGDIFAAGSRQEDAQRVCAEAATAFDEALSQVPDHGAVHYLKARTLFSWGMLMRDSAPNEVTRSRWEEAKVHAERALILAPQRAEIPSLLAVIRYQLDNF